MPGTGGELNLTEGEGLLVAHGNLGWRSEDHFHPACQRLLESSRKELLIDLSNSAGISSANMSLLVHMHYEATDQGKSLKLKVGPEIAKVFDRTRLSDLVGMDIEKVEPDAQG